MPSSRKVDAPASMPFTVAPTLSPSLASQVGSPMSPSNAPQSAIRPVTQKKPLTRTAPHTTKTHQLVFPPAWGLQPQAQSPDSVVLPGGYGRGSSTLSEWIASNISADRANGIVSFPPLFGEAPSPSVETKDYVEWPFGYGKGSTTIRLWLIERAEAISGVHTETIVVDSYEVDVPIIEEKPVSPPVSPAPVANEIYERTVGRTLNYTPEIEVPVLTHSSTHLINQVPVVIENHVYKNVDVHHVIKREIPEIISEWKEETIPHPVTHKVVRQQIVTQDVPGSVEWAQEETRAVEVPVGPSKYQLVTPTVVVDGAAVTYPPVAGGSVELEEETVEIPHQVDVPVVNCIETTEELEVKVPIEVVHVHRKEVVEDAKTVEVVEEKFVQVPHNTIEKVVREFPVFVPVTGRDLESEGYYKVRQVDSAFRDELGAFREEQEKLKQRRDELSAHLAQNVTEINALRKSMLDIAKKDAVVESQLRAVAFSHEGTV